MMKQKFKVIIADDEKLIANHIARLIERTNDSFQIVAQAGNGIEAYELTQKLLPDVIFSDIKMPELDGISLIERLQKDFPSVLTVIVSGYNDFELARSALLHRAIDYLLKPINADDLKKTLQKLELTLLATNRELVPRRDASLIQITENVMAYLRQNYAQQIDFASIAEQQAISAPYLSKIFREHAGISPNKYLIDYRLQIAKKLLLDSDLSIKEISERVGFLDPPHFSKTFKNLVGMNPAQFRHRG